MLPNGWKKVRLSELGTFSKGNGIKRDEANSGSIPAIRYGEIYTAHNDYIKQFQSFISEKVAKEASLLKNGDLLFSCSGETKEDIGKCVAFVSNERAYAGGDIIILSPTVPCDSKYIGFLCNSSFVNKQRYSFAQGDSIVHISSESIGKIEIPFPPLNEQKKIAATLSVWDSAIEKMEKLIEALEERYQSYVNEFFFENQNDKRKLKMGDVFAVRNDRSIATENMPLYSLTIENGITAKTDRYDRGALVKDKDSKKYKIVCDGDIVYNPANLRWGAIGQSKVGHNVVVSPIYEVLYARDNCNNSRYLSHYIMSKKMIAFYSSKTEGTLIERKEVKIDQFLRIDLYIEKDPVRQKKIADVLDLHQEEISNLKQQLDDYNKQKQGLMQKLLTGEWRVK